MEVSSFSLASITLSVLVATAATLAWRLLNWVWLRPKRVEKILRAQGYKGNPYRLLFGDMREIMHAYAHAKSRPINVSEDIAPRVLPYEYQTIQNYGKNSFMWLGPTLGVFILDPEQIKEIMQRNYDFRKPTIIPFLEFIVPGVMRKDGEEWTKHRKILNPAFSLQKLKGMTPTFALCCNETLDKWEKSASSEGWCELDVAPYLDSMTADFISRTALGSSYEEGRRIFILQKEQASLIFKAFASGIIPGSRYLPTKANRKIMALYKEMRVSLTAIINKRVEEMKAGKAAGEDLLGTMLESNMKQVGDNNGDFKSGLTTDDVIDECKLFYLAGQETLSGLLSWTMVMLSRYPDWQARAREEVLRVYGKDEPDFERLTQLKTVTMILNEVLRLYPLGVIFMRSVYKDSKVGELYLPAGSHIFVPAVFLHRDKEYWGDDACEFKPERFSEGLLKATKSPYSYLPFGSGPRICIGQQYAMIAAKTAMAMILQRFSFDLAPSYVHSPCRSLSLQQQHGIRLILRKL